MKPSTMAAALGSVRIAFGVGAIVAPDLSRRMMRFPADHDNASARLITGLFAVREIALGVQMLGARNDPARRSRLAMLNALVDAGDAASNLTFLVRREGIDAAAGGTFVTACLGSAAWARLSRNAPRG